MLSVRAAVIEDADEVASAHVEGWRVGYRGLFPDEYLDADDFERNRRERWRLWTWNDFAGSELFVAVLDDRVVGFSHIGPERQQPTCDQSGTGDITTVDGPIGEVYGFYLHPDAWGSGAAGALMAKSAERLAELRYTDAVLWVLRDNPRARAFYEKAGWRSTGREIMWEGPLTGPRPPDSVAEVQYAMSLLHLV